MKTRDRDGVWREMTRDREWIARAAPDVPLPGGFHHLLATATDSYFVLQDILAALTPAQHREGVGMKKRFTIADGTVSENPAGPYWIDHITFLDPYRDRVTVVFTRVGNDNET